MILRYGMGWDQVHPEKEQSVLPEELNVQRKNIGTVVQFARVILDV